MSRLAAYLHTRYAQLVHTARNREAGMEGIQAAALAGIIGAAVILFAGLVTGKIQELWARIG